MNLSISSISLLTLFSGLLYVTGPGLIIRDILTRQPTQNHRLWVLLTGLLAAGMHLLLSVNHVQSLNGISFGFVNMFSLFTLVISVLFLMSAFRRPIETLSLIIFPIAALAVVMSIFSSDPSSQSLTSTGWKINIHVILSLLAYALLSVAAVQAIMLSIQEKQLHARQPGAFIQSLPSLQLMEQLLFQMIGWGMVMLTLSLISGFIFLDDIFAQHLAHKTLLSIFAWLVFMTLLWGRHHYGWRGQTAIKWTFSGYVALMLAYFGSKFVLEMLISTP